MPECKPLAVFWLRVWEWGNQADGRFRTMSGGPCMIRYTPCSSVWGSWAGRERVPQTSCIVRRMFLQCCSLACRRGFTHATQPTISHTYHLHSPTPGAERAHRGTGTTPLEHAHDLANTMQLHGTLDALEVLRLHTTTIEQDGKRQVWTGAKQRGPADIKASMAAGTRRASAGMAADIKAGTAAGAVGHSGGYQGQRRRAHLPGGIGPIYLHAKCPSE